MRRFTSLFGGFVRGLLLLSCTSTLAARTPPHKESAKVETGALKAVRLRCEYADAPLGIDNPHPCLSWELQSVAPAARGLRQSAYRLLAASSVSLLQAGKADLWDSGRIASGQTVSVEYAGRPLQSGQRVWWSVQVWDGQSRPCVAAYPACWEMGLLKPSDWHAQWIRHAVSPPATEAERFGEMPAPLLRKEFRVLKPIQSARAYVTGLGYYELTLNGRKVGDHVLDPGWTAYARRVLYATYDVTSALRQGKNATGLQLGNGWYDPLPLRMWGHLNLREHLAIGAPRALMQIEIHYKDGTRQTIATDTTWKTHEGPIRKNSVYLGEEYDVRQEQPGWDSPGLDEAGWKNAVSAPEPVGTLSAQLAPPIRATRRFPAHKRTQIRPGVYLFDLGQNFAGWARLRVNGGSPGDRITLRYGELLYPDGALNPLTSAAGQIKGRSVEPGSQAPATAWQADTYVCKGGTVETYTPRFTFHGFRYVEVTGYPGTPAENALEGIGLNADVEKVGAFDCSNPLLTRIQTMVENTFLSNLFSVQSDCPHREKFGYGGDIVATCETAMLNFDMARFYEKAVLDLADSVRPNGGFPETAPFVGIADAGLGEGAGPVEWGTAHPQLVWQRYVMYGDLKTLREQYPNCRRWFALLRAKAVDHLLDNGLSDHESLVPKPTALTGTAFYYTNARLLANMARVLGRSRDVQDYGQEAARIAAAFNQRFLTAGTGRYDNATQACQAIALGYGLTPASEKAAALEVLTRDVLETHGGHLTTGIFGTQALLNTLSEQGRGEVAYTIASQKTFPGWGWMLENGATTLWEHWEFSDNTFSHDHPMFGSISAWFLKSLAGIRVESGAVGFDKIRIQPCVVGGLTWAKGSYHCVRGLVRSEWRKQAGVLYLRIVIPANTSATVYVPAQKEQDVQEGSTPAKTAPGVSFLRMEGGAAVYRVGSGEYAFRAAAG